MATDAELQNFAKDVATEGLGWQDGNTRGMKEQISSLDELVGLSMISVFSVVVGPEQ